MRNGEEHNHPPDYTTQLKSIITGKTSANTDGGRSKSSSLQRTSRLHDAQQVAPWDEFHRLYLILALIAAFPSRTPNTVVPTWLPCCRQDGPHETLPLPGTSPASNQERQVRSFTRRHVNYIAGCTLISTNQVAVR